MSRTIKPITPIDTIYNGYKFRSRLEARWAKFMDEAGVKYRYECQGYSLGELGGYLPDFWLPEWGAWLEIKPNPPTRREFLKAERLAAGMDKPAYILFDEPNVPDPDEWPRPHLPTGAWTPPFAFRVEEGVMDYPYLWCECDVCGMVGLEFEGRGARTPCGCSHSACSGKEDKCINFYSHKLVEAYLAARQERFEAA